MKPVFSYLILCLSFCLQASAQHRFENIARPGIRPELFGPGEISTNLNELNLAISADGSILMYTIANYSSNETFYTIVIRRKTSEGWSNASVAPFSGQFSDADPFFSPQGDRLYFISKRPYQHNATAKDDFDIWFVDIKNGIFSDPKPADNNINSDRDELYPAITLNGNLYFSSENSSNGYDIMMAKPAKTGYDKPVPLGNSINSTGIEFDAFVAPDESYIIFTAMGRSDGFGSGDLYISRKQNGEWAKAVNAGPEINSRFMDQCPFVPADQSALFFTSFRDNEAFTSGMKFSDSSFFHLMQSPYNGAGNIFHVSTSSIFNKMKSYSIIEMPSNLGLAMLSPGREPGVKKLPDWLRRFGFHDSIQPVKTSHSFPPAYSGEIDNETGVRNTAGIIHYIDDQEKILSADLDAGLFPVVLGGDCSILIGNMYTLKKRGKYGVFYLDGHTDYVLPAQSTTGGAAGMDLALIAGLGHERLTDLDKRKPYVREKHIWCVGNREFDTAYLKPLLQSAIEYYDLHRLRKVSISRCIDAFIKMVAIEDLDGFWIHFDVDVLDNNIMPAVDSPAPDGLSYAELREILLPLLSHPKATGIQVTILDPDLDPEGIFTKPFVENLAEILLKSNS